MNNIKNINNYSTNNINSYKNLNHIKKYQRNYIDIFNQLKYKKFTERNSPDYNLTKTYIPKNKLNNINEYHEKIYDKQYEFNGNNNNISHISFNGNIMTIPKIHYNNKKLFNNCYKTYFIQKNEKVNK